MGKKQEKEKIYQEYYQAIFELQDSLHKYSQSIKKALEGLDQEHIKQNMSNSNLHSSKKWLLGAYSNIAEIEHLLLKKLRIYFHHLTDNDLGHSEIDWNYLSHSNQFVQHSNFHIKQYTSRIKNMELLHIRNPLPHIYTESSSPSTPWVQQGVDIKRNHT